MRFIPFKNFVLRSFLICCCFFVSGCATTLLNKNDGKPQSNMNSSVQPVTQIHGITGYDLIAHMRQNFALPNYRNDQVTRYEKWYQNHPNALIDTLKQAEWSLPWIYSQVINLGFPAEIALLPIIESGYNPTVRSSQNAQGLWQLIKTTGQHYGLSQTQWIDERRDLEKSTNAALTYLGELNTKFDGDWLLTLAAYNSGQGRIRKQISKNIAQGGTGSYAELDLLKETKNFAPKLIAIRNIIKNPYAFSIRLPTVPFKRTFVTIPVNKQITHNAIANSCGIDTTTVTILNASHHTPRIPPGTQDLRIPQHCHTEVLALIANYAGEPEVKFSSDLDLTDTYQVKQGDSLWRIARNKNTTIDAILIANPDLRSSTLRPGQTIQLHNSKNRNRNTKTYAIKSGDTLSYIAQLFRVTPEIIAEWNEISIDSILQLGQKLKIY